MSQHPYEKAETAEGDIDSPRKETDVHGWDSAPDDSDLGEVWEQLEADGAFPDPGTPLTSNVPDLQRLLVEKQNECSSLAYQLDQARIELHALRADTSTRHAESREEQETLRELLRQTSDTLEGREAELEQLHHDHKQLKAQNLSLQYHLSQWGLPVESRSENDSEFEGEVAQSKAFFPPLTPLEGSEDPVPVVLKGDLGTCSFPDLIHFLASSRYHGVLTVVGDGVVSKLYLDRGILRLGSWNSREDASKLTTLLVQMGITSEQSIASLKELPLFDLEIAAILLRQQLAPEEGLRSALKQHARFILSFLFQLHNGTFFFQPGRIETAEGLQFQLPVIDVLLHTAAEVDERTRVTT